MMSHTIWFLIMLLSGVRSGVTQDDDSQCGNMEDLRGMVTCDAFVNAAKMDCDDVLHSDPDGTVTETLEDICQKTCCMKNENERRVAELLIMTQEKSTEDSQCSNLEDVEETETCDILINKAFMDCDEVLRRDFDGTVTQTLKDMCQKTCCMKNGNEKKVAEDPLPLDLQGMTPERQTNEDLQCGIMEDERGTERCDGLINKAKMDCDEVLHTNPEGTVTETLKDICQKTCCMKNENERRVAETSLQVELRGPIGERQEPLDDGDCSDLYDKAVGDQCKNLMNLPHFDCPTTVFTNPDNSTSTLKEICAKTCCLNSTGAALEKKILELPLNLEVLWDDGTKERATDGECTDLYNDCEEVMQMNGVNCDTTFQEHLGTDKQITVGIDWCRATCGNC